MSNIDLVLLGLIKQKSQSAYDIKKNIEYCNIPDARNFISNGIWTET